MDETGRLREALALASEERVALEVVPGCYLMLQSQYQKWEAVSSVITDTIGSNDMVIQSRKPETEKSWLAG